MRFSLALLALLLVLPALSLAQGLDGPADPRGISSTPDSPEPRTFGIAATTFVALSTWDFVPIDSTVTFQINNAPIGRTISRTNASGGTQLAAPLHLPEGAVVTEMQAVFCDTSPTAFFSTVFLQQPRGVPPFGVFGPSSTSLATPGCQDLTVQLSVIVIDNNNNTYYVQAALGAADTTIQLQSVRVGYHLQVSPAPATATFTDVPTNHPFFQFIEALAAAGITGGCSTTPPLYCPDAQVTRGQMAAFISKALGLQFAP